MNFWTNERINDHTLFWTMGWPSTPTGRRPSWSRQMAGFIEWLLLYVCNINSILLFSNQNSLWNRVNFHSICHWRHSLGSDVSDHFFWSEYRVESRPVHSIFTPKEVIITDVTTQGVTSVTSRVKIHSILKIILTTGVRIEWNSLLNEWNFFTP